MRMVIAHLFGDEMTILLMMKKGLNEEALTEAMKPAELFKSS